MSETISCREWVLSQIDLIRDDLIVFELEVADGEEESQEIVARCIETHLQNIEKEVEEA